MRLLVAGAAGQVGTAVLARAAREGVGAVGLARADLDLTDADAVDRALGHHAPSIVVNAAAYTAVDRAEAEPEQAFAVNRDGAAHLARACAREGVPLVHLSTDYVFDGAKGAPYLPSDPPRPLSVYGQSKWAGEEAVRAALDRHVIVRTAWVFSATGHNFVRTMLRLAQARDALRVVADQTGHPTAADDIARLLLAIARAARGPGAPWGTYHLGGTPPASWHALAEATLACARQHGPVRATRVEPIATEAYPTPARRPPSVVLDQSETEARFGLPAPRWRKSLERTVAVLAGPRSKEV